jgi:hypothetical protein
MRNAGDFIRAGATAVVAGSQLWTSGYALGDWEASSARRPDGGGGEKGRRID